MGGGHPKMRAASAIWCQYEGEYSNVNSLTFKFIMKTTLQAINKYINAHKIDVCFLYISKRTHTFVDTYERGDRRERLITLNFNTIYRSVLVLWKLPG